MTALGICFFVAYAVTLAFRRELFPYVLGVAACVPDSGALVIGVNGISPFYVGVILAVPLLIARRSQAQIQGIRILRREEHHLLLFVSSCVVITILGPKLFSGIQVRPPRLGLDAGYTVPLAYNVSNFAQCLYVVLGALVVIYLGVSGSNVSRLFEFILWTGLIAALLIYAGSKLGFQFPYSFIDNQPNRFYSTLDPRARGTFSEASKLGAFASYAIAYFVFQVVRTTGRHRFRGLLGTAASGYAVIISASGTAVITLLTWLVLVLVLMFGASARRSGWRVRPQGVALSVTLMLPVVLLMPLVVRAVNQLVKVKLQESSFSNRRTADTAALHVFLRTLGLGTGLGGDQASSLATTMLATVGVVGSGLLILVVWQAVGSCLHHGSPRLAFAALVGLTAEIISVADLSFPLWWVCLGCCLGSGMQGANDHSPVARAQFRSRALGLESLPGPAPVLRR